MSEWDERIREHRVWNDLNTLGPAIDSAAAVEGISPESILGLERLRAILAYSGKRIAAADPIITPPSPLDAVASVMPAIQNELTAFISDKNPGHITNANISADSVLIALSTIPGLYSPEELGVLVASTTEHRRAVSKALSEANKKLNTFETKSNDGLAALDAKLAENAAALAEKVAVVQTALGAVVASIETERTKLATITSDQQGQFSTSQDARSKEFTESLRLANEGFTKLVTDYQSQFSAAQDTRGKEYTAAESARQSKYIDTVADFVKKLAEQDSEFSKQRIALVSAAETALSVISAEYQAKSAKVLEDIEEKQRRVEKLVGVIGNLAVTSGYLRTANQARRAMWGWQALTVIALITLSSLAYRTLGVLEDQNGHFNWGGFAARALLLVSLGVIAAYSGTQADKLFSDERRNRKLALELEAIGPYLAPLPEEEQNKFRLLIGGQSFGRETDPHDHRKSPSSVLDLFKTKESKELLEFLIEIAKKVKDSK